MSISSFYSRNKKKRKVISDINITPFVDVLLVLLIIFMISAPMMTSSVNVSLPKGSGKPTIEKRKPISVSIKSNGTVFIEDELIKISSLAKKILQLTDSNMSSKIHIKADVNLDYGRVMKVVKVVNLAGFSQVILVTELVQ